MSDIYTKAPTPEYRDGWDRIFGDIRESVTTEPRWPSRCGHCGKPHIAAHHGGCTPEARGVPADEEQLVTNQGIDPPRGDERGLTDTELLDWLDEHWHDAFVGKYEPQGYLPWDDSLNYYPKLRDAIKACIAARSER